MKNKRSEPFADVEFHTEYPGNRVADHEVFLSFNGDDQAVAFRDWWHEEGAAFFGDWVRKTGRSS